ncbi:MAG: serine/threonine protein kinase [Alistipes sp.]|nr:serine/threonine protein kinase [Alistipes sp.]
MKQDFDIKKILGRRYRVGRRIGKGGMGCVYQVYCGESNRQYAAKVIENTVGDQGEEEARLLSKLNHPMLPEIREYFHYDYFTVIIMEYIYGSNMEEYIKKNGPASRKKAVLYLRQLADVLTYLHGQKPPVIYRDLKPSNIMVENKDSLKLIDFGTARSFKGEAGSDTVALGTPGYAAPEQLSGVAQSDARTDIYSLGATMYYILTGIDIGRPPFEAKPIHLIRSDIDDNLSDIIVRCLQKNPDSRFQSVADLIRELDYGEVPFRKQDRHENSPINIVITHSNKSIKF